MLLWSGTALASDGDERWEGAYGGIHVGASWLSGSMTAYTPYNSYAGFPVTGLNDSAIIGGVQLGYNIQMDSGLVFGLEATASLTDIDKGAYTPIDALDDAPDNRLFWRKSDFTATVAPRIGYASDSFLITGKAGLAIADFEVGHDQNGTDIVGKKTKFGYVLGAGVEYALTSRISAGVQYDYENFGSKSIGVSGSPDIDIDQGGDLHVAKVVLNYQF